MRRAVLLVALLFTACARLDLPPVSDEAAFHMERDEKRLWLQAWAETDAIDRSGILYNDAALEDYLNGIARRLQPAAVLRNIPFTVRVLRDPTLNAFAFPNGMLYVHSGLLAAMESEAQFAALIAHEMTHATHRHAVRSFRHERNEMAVAAALRTVTGSRRRELQARASVAGYSQELEAEADAEGLALAVRAGYDPRDAVRFFERLREEVLARDSPEPFFYATHPRIQERIESMAGLIAARYAGAGGIVKAEEFFRRTAGLVLENAALDIRAARFGNALRSLGRYRERCPADDARPLFLLAELYRKRGLDGDAGPAKRSYEAALALDPTLAEAHRGLGLLLFRIAGQEAAEPHFRAYRALRPAAADRDFLPALPQEGAP